MVNLKPIVPGHVLIVPLRTTVLNLSDLTMPESQDYFKTLQLIHRFIKWQYKADSINVAIQDGPEAGQSVPHLHTHIIPRYKINNVGDLIYDKLDHWDGNGTLTDWQGRRGEYLGVGGRQARKNNSTSATVDGDELSQGPNVLKPDSQRKVRALTEMKKEAEDLQARLEEFVSSDPGLTQWL